MLKTETNLDFNSVTKALIRHQISCEIKQLHVKYT